MIFLSKIRPPHMQLVWPYLCKHAVILQRLFCHELNNSKWCLPSFVSTSPCTMLLPRCLLLNLTACGINRWACFQEKSTVCNNFIQKWGMGLLSRVGHFREITVLVKHSTDLILARAVVGNTILVQYWYVKKLKYVFCFFTYEQSIPWLQKYPMHLLHNYCDVLSLQKLSTCSITVSRVWK